MDAPTVRDRLLSVASSGEALPRELVDDLGELAPTVRRAIEWHREAGTPFWFLRDRLDDILRGLS